MEFLIPGLYFAAMLAMLLWLRRRRQAEAGVLRGVAHQAGLSFRRGVVGASGPAVSGTYRGRRVAIETVVERRGRNSARSTAFVAFGGTTGATFQKRGAWGGLLSRLGPGGGQVGDPAFDEAVSVSGDEWSATAILDADTRARVLAFLTTGPGEARIEAGRVSRQLPGSVGSQEQAAAMLEEVVELAERLEGTQADWRANLARIVTSDPEPGVRLRAIEALSRFPAEGEVRAALAQACRDPDPAMRLQAAAQLGDVPRLLELGLDAGAADDVRAAAIHAAMKHGGGADAQVPAFARLAGGADVPTVRTPALELIARVDGPAAAAILRRLKLDDAGDAEVFVDAAPKILGAEATAGLVALLASPDPDIRLAAIQGLAGAGTVDAVEPLHRLADRLLGLGGQANAAAAAIGAIQARLGRAERGTVALATSTGAVSVAEEAGRVDAVERPRPKVERVQR